MEVAKPERFGLVELSWSDGGGDESEIDCHLGPAAEASKLRADRCPAVASPLTIAVAASQQAQDDERPQDARSARGACMGRALRTPSRA